MLKGTGKVKAGKKVEERELLEIFFSQANILIDVLGKAIVQEDNLAWKNAAHKLKGAAANLGANPLSELCFIAENTAESLSEEKQKQ